MSDKETFLRHKGPNKLKLLNVENILKGQVHELLLDNFSCSKRYQNSY